MGGTLKSTPPLPPGATHIVPLDNAVAVVASNTWSAMEAAKEIEGDDDDGDDESIWEIPPDAALLDSDVFHEQAMHLLGRGEPKTQG